MREKWAGANLELRPDVLASLRAPGLIRIRFVYFHHTMDSSLSLVVVEWGENGPARLRIAVTATRRPKDTKLPHRPAPERRVVSFLTLPDWYQKRV